MLGKPLIDDGEKLGIRHGRRGKLLHGLDAAMGLENFIARGGGLQALGQRRERGDHAALPVDERAVAVERQDLEVREFHVALPSDRRRNPGVAPSVGRRRGLVKQRSREAPRVLQAHERQCLAPVAHLSPVPLPDRTQDVRVVVRPGAQG